MRTRLRAVMLTDLAGYTAFSAGATRSDIAAAIRQQKRIIAPVIKAYRGRIVKWIGDAVLCVFDSTTDAVLCGREIQVAVIRRSARGAGTTRTDVKVVVHAGDINIDLDGDIYGDTVNVCARMEKSAQPGEVYFSDAVRLLISRAEIPFERIGTYSYKGVAEDVQLFRTCFGNTPVIREQLALVQTNFTHIQDIGDKFGWDATHPVAEKLTESIIESARTNGGTNRGVHLTGCTLTFERLADALAAVTAWQSRRKLAFQDSKIPPSQLKIRTAVHWGTIHVMKYTMMGLDLDVVRTLAPLGYGQETLISADAMEIARKEGVQKGFRPISPVKLRECRSRSAWISKFQSRKIFIRPLSIVG